MTTAVMSEADLQRSVIEAARWRGWLVHHCRAAQRQSGQWATPIQGDAGFPDLCMVHPSGRMLVRELKSARGKVAAEQSAWLDAFRAVGVDATVWRPADLACGAVLRALSTPGGNR